MPSMVIVPASTKPAVEATVSFFCAPGRVWPAPLTVVVAACVGLFGFVELDAVLSEPLGLALPVVGPELSVSARTLRLLPLTGVAALLSMYASESVMKTATAMPAPEPAAEESAFVVTLVLTLDVIATSPPVAEIQLVPDSWLLPNARTNVAATDESWSLASVHGSSRPW